MKNVIKNVDSVVDIWDALVRFSGRNLVLRVQISTINPVVVAFNKADLVTRNKVEKINTRYKNGGGVGVERYCDGVEVAS
jgi:ribosome biogenesis GTPase A